MPFGTAGAIKDLIPPNPIVPTKGEQNLMDVVQKFPLKDIQTALDNFPVPYVVVAQAGAGRKAEAPATRALSDRYLVDRGAPCAACHAGGRGFESRRSRCYVLPAKRHILLSCQARKRGVRAANGQQWQVAETWLFAKKYLQIDLVR